MNPRISIALAMLCACHRYWICDVPERSDELPRRLSETGLYADIAAGQLASGIVAYTPAFELWSDGADKQRWILLPDGARIDSTDMDEWVFPAGTRVWKQFSVGGTRVETRLLAKLGVDDHDWVALSYVWDPDDRDASAAVLGVVDARGTEHDVPAAGECAACHGGRRSFVLGFSAIQIDLSTLIAQDRLTRPPTATPIVPGTELERAALGYLHGNCSHCHNQTRPEREGARCFDPENDLDFTLAIDELGDVASTATYRTVVRTGALEKVMDRTDRRGVRGMPPLATEQVDSRARALLQQWIEALR